MSPLPEWHLKSARVLAVQPRERAAVATAFFQDLQAALQGPTLHFNWGLIQAAPWKLGPLGSSD